MTTKLNILTRMRRRWNRMLTNKAGQSTTEYILILAIVVMIASQLRKQLSTKIVGAVNNLNFESVMSQDPNSQ